MISLQTFGIDISRYSGQVDWTKVVANVNPRFVFVCAAYVEADKTNPKKIDANADPMFPIYWPDLLPLKIPRGAYVLCHPLADPAVTTDTFFKAYTPQPGDLLPTLDIEDIWDNSCGLSAPARISLIQTMVDSISKRINGQKPLIYTKTRVWNDLTNPMQFASCPLWIMNYETMPTPLNLPPTWQTFAFWQYAQNVDIQNIGIDDYDPDLFNGSEAELKNFTIQKVTA